jgi:hypothetical protein
MENEKQYTRPENLLKALGIDFKGPNEEEQIMKKLLAEEYKKRKRSLIDAIRQWRESHPEATLGDAIRSLYKEIEDEI